MRPQRPPGATQRRKPRGAHVADAGSIRRARVLLIGAVVVSAVLLCAWFPATSLLSQRSALAGAQSQIATLHEQDNALAQEKKNLSDAGEIGRIAREQYQLVSPGQTAYEVLPPSGASGTTTPYAGDPGSNGPVTPSASAELPPGGVTTTTLAPGTSSGRSTGSSAKSGAGQASPGFFSRVEHSLEFWR